MMREDERPLRRRVASSSEGADDSFVMTEEQVKMVKSAIHKDRSNPLVTSIIWMIIGGFVYFYFDLQSVLLFDPRIPTFWLRLSAVLFGVSCGTGTLCVLASLLFKVDYEQQFPWAIPLAAGTGVLCVLSFIVTFWPVFGVFSIPLVLVCTISFVLTLGTLPSAVGL